MIRIIIKPFIWLFAIVYNYSEYFEPFMSSPMPLIIGRLKGEEDEKMEEDTGTEFIVVDLDEKGKDIKDKELFHRSIKRLKKQYEKGEDKADVLRKYVNNLRGFVMKGVLDQEPTDFHIELIETQLVSYFKDKKDK